MKNPCCEKIGDKDIFSQLSLERMKNKCDKEHTSATTIPSGGFIQR